MILNCRVENVNRSYIDIYVARFIASIDVSNAGDYKAAISVQPGTGFYKGESVAYYSKKL